MKRRMPGTALNIVQRVFPQVTEIEDGKKDVHINVTKSDTSTRQVRNHKACALAVACKRELELDGAIVARSIAYLVQGKIATRYRVPQSAAREIVAFDRGAQFEPGEYTLKGIPKNMRFGVRRKSAKVPKLGSRSPIRKKMFRHTTGNIRTSLLSSAFA